MDAFDRNPARDSGRAEFPQPFGKYTLLGRLGTGGMADALLAMLHGAMGFQKPVVLKRMHASLGRDSHFVKMFLDEARLAARLGHANVVATSEVGECDGHYFIAMDYLEGVSLDRIARKYIHDGREVPLGLLLRVLCDCLDGLHYAHELRDYDGAPLGVVHRDVTPSNLFVTSSGVAKVLDFGIAKASTQDEATRTGMLKGKLAYMSPEQFYDAPIDRRSDVWSMGVVVWEMVTGRRLFKGANDAQTYRNIMGAEVPPVGSYRRDAPAALDPVIARALARDREQRYQSAEEMRRGLEEVLHGWLANTSHREVAAEIAAHFGETLEESRRAIHEFTRRPPKELKAPRREEDDDDENPTEVNSKLGAALKELQPLGIAPIAPASPRAARGAASTLDEAWNPDEDESGSSTVVDVKLPQSLAAAAASIPVRPTTLPAARPVVAALPLLGAAPMHMQQGVSSGPSPFQGSPPMDATVPSSPPSYVPPFDPVPRDVGPAKPRRAVQALGWLALIALVGGLVLGAYTQRDVLARGVRELLDGAPPDPAHVGSFQLRIVSVPAGARVFDGATDLGPTPLEVSVPRSVVADAPRSYALRLDGYAPAAAVQRNTLAPRAELRVVLERTTPRAETR